MTRISITGGGGFVGRNVIPRLLEKGHSVTALQRDSEIVPARHPSLTVMRGNLRSDTAVLASRLQECDVLLHLAGDTTPAVSAADVNLEFELNVVPFAGLLNAVPRESSLKRVVILSSGGTVYGQPQFTPIDESHQTMPTTPYGLGKLAIEHLTRQWATSRQCDFILIRAANLYGPYQYGRNNQGVIGVWLQNIMKNEPLVVWGSGDTVRDYVYVGDLAEALALSCERPELSSGIFNVGSGSGHTLLQIAQAIEKVTGLEARIEFTPAKPFSVAANVLSPARFHSMTGWQARTDLQTGIDLTYRFLRRERQ